MQMRGILKFVKEEIIGSENTFLAWAVLAATGVIIAIGFYLNSPDASFHGIAGSRESNVNFEYPVEIRSVHVLAGQRVRKGDLLAELDQSELNTQIRQLTAQITKLKAERSVRDQMNKAVGNLAESLAADPMTLDIQQLEEERSYLERQRNNLYVFAEIDGIVGSVNFKRGERAPAFSPIVTILPDSPTFVQGFIYESQQSSVKPGSHVKINSLTNAGASVQGRVISVGSRFVEIPVRLAPSIKGDTSGVWGREVTVEIPKDSQIILGEKVQISPVRAILSAFLAQADDELPTAQAQLRSVRVPAELADKSNFEASGAVYLKDLKKYLIVSDDTDNRDSPWVFLMSADGEVEERPLVIPGIKEVTDLESASAEGEYIYVMSSLSSRRKGKIDPARNILVRFKRDGRELKDTQVAQFGTILRDLIAKSSHPLLSGLAGEGLEKLEVESQSVHDGALYIALKSPPFPNSHSALILKVSDVESLFTKNGAKATLEVWKNPRLNAKDLVTQRITDITFVGNNLYFTTSCKGEKCGAFWKIGENESTPIMIQSYKDDSPEGVAYDEDKNTFLITFDLGNDGSKFTTVSGPRSPAQ
jgi:multidrug resistance efflux pump